MNEKAAVKSGAALVVFGQTDKNVRHAGWFTAAESVAVNKAASIKSLSVIEPIPDEVTAFLSKIARGRFVMGQLSLAKADQAVYDKLLQHDAGPKQPQEAKNEAPRADLPSKPLAPADTAPPSVPTSADVWNRIKVGDPVLAPYEGWWEARVVAIAGETVRVAWLGAGDEWDEVPRASIALLQPKR